MKTRGGLTAELERHKQLVRQHTLLNQCVLCSSESESVQEKYGYCGGLFSRGIVRGREGLPEILEGSIRQLGVVG